MSQYQLFYYVSCAWRLLHQAGIFAVRLKAMKCKKKKKENKELASWCMVGTAPTADLLASPA